MLKIVSRHEKINRRMVSKESTRFFYKFFLCTLTLSKNSSKKRKNLKTTQVQNLSKMSSPNSIGSKNYVFLSYLHRYGVHWQSKLVFRSPFTKARTICFLTGRSRSIYRAFRLSRLKVREYGAMGHFVGLSKASW